MFESDVTQLRIECEGHVTSLVSHVYVCECAASAELSQLFRSALSDGNSSCMRIVSSFVDCVSVTTDDYSLEIRWRGHKVDVQDIQWSSNNLNEL